MADEFRRSHLAKIRQMQPIVDGDPSMLELSSVLHLMTMEAILECPDDDLAERLADCGGPFWRTEPPLGGQFARITRICQGQEPDDPEFRTRVLAETREFVARQITVLSEAQLPWKTFPRRALHVKEKWSRVLLENSHKTWTSQGLALLLPEKIFSLSGRLLKALPLEVDRKILYSRLNKHLNGKRRGRLYLPRYFPQEVRRLSDMSKAQIRRHAYWVTPSARHFERLPKAFEKRVNLVYPGGLWNRSGSEPFHMANSVALPRLGRKEHPRITRSIWPSTPSFSEMLVMSRSGVSHLGRDPFRSLRVKDCLKKWQLEVSPKLTSRIVARQIVGVRAETELPDKFLKWFRYRQGFLILTVRHSIPIGLCRFLIGRWVCDPSSLWLVENCFFKQYLKRHTTTEFIRDGLGSPVASDFTSDGSDGLGSPNSNCSIDSMVEFERLVNLRLKALGL